MPQAAEVPPKKAAAESGHSARSARLLVPSVEQLGQIMTWSDLVGSRLSVIYLLGSRGRMT